MACLAVMDPAAQRQAAVCPRLRAQGGDVLIKPFDLDLLLEKVRDLIGGAGAA